jgi:site-specific recombinase XerD
MGGAGLEPATPRTSSVCSTGLSYEEKFEKFRPSFGSGFAPTSRQTMVTFSSPSFLGRRAAIGKMTLAEAKELFRIFCQSRGLSRRTLEIYGDAILELERFLGGPDAPLPSRADMQRFSAHLLYERNLKPTTVSIKLRAIRSFLNFLLREGLIEENPMYGLPLPKVPKKFPRILTPDQVAALLRACDTRTFSGIRNKAMILVFLDCGLRLKELIALNVGDVNLLTRQILVREGKGGKERVVYFGSVTEKALSRWIKVRGYAPPFAPFFCTKDGGRLDRRNVQRILERLAKRAGLQGVKVSPHRLRHTSATLFVAFGGPLPALQELLGHSSLRTTEIYLHLAGSLREIHAMASPADKLVESL